ncbi:SCO family protein [uncultured Tateyamaria sp.]|uniref:SCO family protein n=1 Tax=uncultured Tateyamaria sp. TaxID=455651 RepID=UPI002637AF3F|nr:SCO family protein [uncultured Tateyamaria sp.]
MTRIIAPVAVLVAALFVAATFWFSNRGGEDGAFAQCNATQIAGDGNSIGGPFELVNAAGETVTDADVITEPSLIYFGYTFCPDVCPLDTARNAEAVDVLAERGMSVTPVFITIDPERDTPDVVGDFAYNLHEKMIGLTGSPEQTDAASKAYRTYYKAHDKSDEFYLVDHSTFTYLVLPEHGFVEFFRRDIDANTMADRVGCFVENA